MLLEILIKKVCIQSAQNFIEDIASVSNKTVTPQIIEDILHEVGSQER